MARKNGGIYTDNLVFPNEAREMWKILGDVSEILDEAYDESFFGPDFNERFPERAPIKEFINKCAEMIQAYNKMNKIKIQNEIKQYEAKIAELKSLIGE